MFNIIMADLNDRELLVQIGTKLEGLSEIVKETRQSVSDLNRKMEDMESKMKDRFVTKEEFEPIKRLVYGVVGLVMTAILLALVAQIIVQ